MVQFIKQPSHIVESLSKPIYVFDADISVKNVDQKVVESFGEEWSKFNDFDMDELNKIGAEYFNICLPYLNKETYAMDMGCGTGRWSKYLSDKVRFIEAVDPSVAIYSAEKLLGNTDNVRLSQAFVDNLPFPDGSFDFVMSVGVLHHIPNTKKAMQSCVDKLKNGGIFYAYLYYNLENRGILFKTIFHCADGIRRIVSILPSKIKKVICDALAILLYMPFVLLSRFFYFLGLQKISDKIPLSAYRNKNFYIIRNDALDRFGTSLEQRFSKDEIRKMMEEVGLEDIIFGNAAPFYHMVGKKKYS